MAGLDMSSKRCPEGIPQIAEVPRLLASDIRPDTAGEDDARNFGKVVRYVGQEQLRYVITQWPFCRRTPDDVCHSLSDFGHCVRRNLFTHFGATTSALREMAPHGLDPGCEPVLAGDQSTARVEGRSPQHLEEYGPGGKSQKHGHVNEAAFYILDGEGYEIHDDIRYDWKAGDVAIVHNNCVHQHFNASDTKPARALVLKTKPMFVFTNMLFQKTVEPRETTPAPGGEDFEVREEEDDFNHPEEGY